MHSWRNLEILTNVSLLVSQILFYFILVIVYSCLSFYFLALSAEVQTFLSIDKFTTKDFCTILLDTDLLQFCMDLKIPPG